MRWRPCVSSCVLVLAALLSLQQIRTAGARPLDRLGATPFLDLGVVAAEERGRHGFAAKLGGTRVLRVLEQALCRQAVRLLARGLFVAEDAGQEAHRGLDDR